MSLILNISAVNYDRKHLENSKIGLEKSETYFFQKSGNPVMSVPTNKPYLYYTWQLII